MLLRRAPNFLCRNLHFITTNSPISSFYSPSQTTRVFVRKPPISQARAALIFKRKCKIFVAGLRRIQKAKS